ncbi:MAG: hypothetical protein U0610_25650 [bacterium]
MSQPTPPTSRSRPTRWLLALGLVGLGFAAYLPCLRIPAWETDTWVIHLLAQRALRAGSWHDAFQVVRFIIDNPKGWSDLFILASWFALYAITGPSLVAFHVFGVACHCATGCLLYGFARRQHASARTAAWAAAWFLLAPLNQDVVAVEAHSQYPMFGVLFLGSLALAARWRDAGSRRALAAALVLYLLALTTKELAFALPAILLFEAMSTARAGDGDPHRRRRAWTVLVAASALALPFLVRPFWVALEAPQRATSPADAALLRDLLAYLHPAVLTRKLFTELGCWAVVPFAAEGPARAAFPWNLALSVGTFAIALAGRLRERARPAGRVACAALILVLGYLPVGFQLDARSFEKTGELYLATMGAALLWGELLGGTTERAPRIRSILGGALAIAMFVHLQLLHQVMAAHGRRVEAAERSLEITLDTASADQPIVLVGEEMLDRGAVDAVLLALAHRRGALTHELSWIGGTQTLDSVASCPAGVTRIDRTTSRFLRWNDRTATFDVLASDADVLRALEWRNPDPERIWIRAICIDGLVPPRLAAAELLTDLRPESILPRL